MMSASRSESRDLNRRIDRLLDAGIVDVSELTTGTKPADPMMLAERIRRRAARRVRLQPVRAREILWTRDRLIFAVYASPLPADGFSAWCDGSSMRTDSAASNGIGAIVTDAHGAIVAKTAGRVLAVASFETEIAALEQTLELASGHGARHLRAHTDCPALAQLWSRHPHDRRLAAIRRLARRFERFELKAVPREHNQPAHRLAKAAAQGIPP